MVHTLLNLKRVGPFGGIVLKGRKIKRAAEVASIIDAAATPVRHVPAELQEVFAGGPTRQVVQLNVVLRSQDVGLGAASGERALDHNRRGRGHAAQPLVLAAHQGLKLVDEPGRHGEPVVDDEFPLPMIGIGPCLGKREPPHAEIVAGILAVVELPEHGVIGRELVADAQRKLGKAAGAGSGLLNRSGKSLGEDDSLQIVFLAASGEQKCGFSAMSKRAEQRAFQDAPLLGSAKPREVVAGIQTVVPEREAERAMERGTGVLRNDLDAPPAGPGKLRRVGILVDADLLDGRRTHAERAGFHTIHDQRRTARARGTGIQENGHPRYIVLIEHGKLFHEVRVHGRGIAVGGRLGRDLAVGIVDGDFRGDARDFQSEGQPGPRPGAKPDASRHVVKAVVLGLHGVGSGRKPYETEIARISGLNGFEGFVQDEQPHGCAGYVGSALVEHRAGDRK